MLDYRSVTWICLLDASKEGTKKKISHMLVKNDDESYGKFRKRSP